MQWAVLSTHELSAMTCAGPASYDHQWLLLDLLPLNGIGKRASYLHTEETAKRARERRRACLLLLFANVHSSCACTMYIVGIPYHCYK